MKLLVRLAVAISLVLIITQQSLAHCDTMNGPVVKAARAALQGGNLNLVLIWVARENENEVKHAFQQTLAVRKLNRTARDLADKYFFETVVRIHRAGEGEPYTGLKPATTEVDVFTVTDKALETGAVEPLLKMFPEHERPQVQRRFNEALASKNYDVNNVDAGRKYVAAYISFLHFVEHLNEEHSQ